MENSKANNNTLRLSLKTKWFEMTKAGIKTEDYREITPYWFSRLVFQKEKALKYLGIIEFPINQYCVDRVILNERNRKMIAFKPFNVNAMTLGYPISTDTDRILTLEHKGIEVRTGNPEWGAEEGKLYFVILHGRII